MKSYFKIYNYYKILAVGCFAGASLLCSGCSFFTKCNNLGNITGSLNTDTELSFQNKRPSVFIKGMGNILIEEDYLPHVLACENFSASFEALKAQAVAARSYVHYKIKRQKKLIDSQLDQVYSCSHKPQKKHYDAVKSTYLEIMMYQSSIVAGFYVAGAIPSGAECRANKQDKDRYNTEKFVTYNWENAGNKLKQCQLGMTGPEVKANRGCKSQNGAHCLAQKGFNYKNILKFYYGKDVQIIKQGLIL